MPIVPLDPNDPLDQPAPDAATATPKIVPLAADQPLDQPHNAAQTAATFATGANDLLTTALGAPVDLATAAINKAPWLLNRLSGGAIPEPEKPLITAPIGGSQSLRDLMAGTIGRTEPQNAVERGLYSAGAATMSVPLTGMAAAAGPASLAEALTPASVPAWARSTAIAAGSGVGGSAARDVAANISDNPWLQAGADIAGGAAGGLATGGVLGGGRLGAQIARPLTAGGQETIAGRLLNRAAGGPEVGLGVPGLAAEPQPTGITPTLGDLTGVRGLQAVQRAVEAGTPEAGTAAQAIASRNNQAIRAAFEDIGQPGTRTPQQISEDAAQRLEAMRAGQHTQASGAFQTIDPGGQALVPTGALRDQYDNYVTGLTAARRRFLPDSYAKLLDSYEAQEPLRELQDFASTLKTDARQAGSGANPDYNRANVLNGLHDALFPGGGPEDLLGAGQADVGDALRAARDQWRQYRDTYNTPSVIKNALRPDGTPDSAALDRILGSGQGQTERVQQFLRAAQGDPDLLQAGRDWFAAKMRAAGEVAAQDQQGGQFLNGNQLRKFRQTNQPLIDSPLFSDQHRQAINDVVDAANTVQRTARAGTAGGSDTYRNLQTGNYLSEMGMGPLAKTLASAPEISGGSLGGYVGAHFLGPPGAIIGVPAGAALGHLLSYQGPRANVVDLIGRATRDPTLAGQLMERAAARPPTPRGISLQDLLAGAAGTAVGR